MDHLIANPHGYEENKGTDSLNENVRHVQNENIAMTFCKFCDKFSNLPNDDCCGNKVHEGENYITDPVKNNSIKVEGMNTVKIVTNIKIQDLPKLVLIESGNVMEINTTGDDNPKNDPLGEEIFPKIEKSDNFKEEEDFESKTISVSNILNVIHEDHCYI